MEVLQRASRRAFGATWMTLYGAAATSAIWWALWPAPVWLALWCVVTLAMGLVLTMQLIKVRTLMRGQPRQTFDRRLARNIGLVMVAYAVVEGIAAGGLHASGHDALIFPVAVAIAGAHFFLFGRVLATWQYYAPGILDCLASAITVVISESKLDGRRPAVLGLLSASRRRGSHIRHRRADDI
ncbi:MAG TPA: hypothetical protein VIJ91_10445 [Candidatus Dormibacteraeota bacterium]|jgi:hypothetical protein